MPELLTLQDLANGHLDVKALGEAANGDENTIVTTRTGNTYPSAERAINIMFQNGGLPAAPFATKAQMETDGTSLADGQLAMVYNETANNGLYQKMAGAWVKAAYDPLLQAREYTDATILDAISNIDTTKGYELTVASKNLFDVSKTVTSQYLNTTDGRVMRSEILVGYDKWLTSDFIPIQGGETYTLSGTRGRHGLAFFTEKSVTNIDTGEVGETPLLYVGSTAMPLTVTAPVGANYVMFNIHSDPAQPYSNLMLEKSAVATAYEPFYIVTKINPEFIAKSGSTLVSSKLVINGDGTASLDADKVKLDFQLRGTPLNAGATVFNFTKDTFDGAVVRTLGDDVAPLRIDGATVGANHGYFKIKIAGTHNKTVADIGSVWTDATNEWVVVDVPSSSVIEVTSRLGNISTLSASSLTHVSGATSTTAINSSSKTMEQWYPPFRDYKQVISVDDVKINQADAQTHNYKNNVAVHESYNLMAKADIVEWLIINKGVRHTEYKAAPMALCNYSYVFDVDGGCTIYASLTAYKDAPFQDFMTTQSVKLDSSARLYYVPKSKAFAQSSVNYDFSTPYAMPSAIATSIKFDNNKLEVGANPIDRLIQFDSNVGYATGFLPLYDAEPTVRATNAPTNYVEVRNNSLKIYPRLIENAGGQITAGTTYSGISYRKYFKRDAARTAKYVVRSQIADFLYLDWHSAKTDVIGLDDDLIGRAFTVHEKSSNVTVLSKFATNNIAVKIDATKSYGYLVLRFDK